MLAGACGTPVSAAVSAALDAQNEHPACREAAIRELEAWRAGRSASIYDLPAAEVQSAPP